MRILSTLRGLLRQTPVTNGRLEGDMDANGQRIVNVGEPTLDDDAATKRYVDDHGGGGGGTDDYNDLENKPTLNGETLQGAVVLTGVDIETEPNSGRLVTEAIAGVGNDLYAHEKRDDNPHEVTAEQVGAYTTDQVDGMLANKANSSDVYDKEDVDLKLSAKQDTLTPAQEAVLDGGPYLGKIGQQKIESDTFGFGASLEIENGSSSGGKLSLRGGPSSGGEITVEDGEESPASIKKGGKEVATEDLVNGLSQYPIKAVVGNALLDRTVNTSTGGAFTFPEGGDGARDFVVVVAASSTAPSVSFPSSGVTYFSDDDAVWTAESDKLNVWYFTEVGTDQFMVAHKALAQSTQA